MNHLKNKWVWLGLSGMLAAIIVIVRNPFYPGYPPPRPGTGAVIGKLDLGGQETSSYNAQDLYLARIVEASSSDLPPVIAFTYSTDPHTAMHEPDGRFAFTDVPPATYALIVWHPGLSFVIESPEGGLIKVFVEANKTIDLGTVVPSK